MKVLVEIVHPANVLFFFRPIQALRARGDEVLIVSRDKDVALDLLDSFGLKHRILSRVGKGALGLALELLRRDFALWRVVRRFRPDVMIGYGGVAISHVGKLTGIPAIAFYDSENAKLQTRLTWPFITHLYAPDSYTGQVPEGRTTRIRGSKDLSFFHPSAFKPSRETALKNGLDPDRDNFFVRVVSWGANHDIGKAGWTGARLDAVVERLERLGRVHISSEVPLPERLAARLYRGERREVHHLLAFCRLYVGESATMGCEAVTLGAQAIYNGHDFPGYTQALESAGLLRNVPFAEDDGLMEIIEAALARPRSDFEAAREAWLSSCPDWAEAVIEALSRHAAVREAA